MKKGSFAFCSSIILLSLLSACGGSSGGGGSSSVEQQQEEALATDGSNIQGLYLATFSTLNSHVNGTVPGSVTFQRKDDRFYAYVRLFAGFPRAWHMQNVYEGGRCPTASDDLNGDGFIDITEAQAVLGKVLIPLDSDISSQNSGRNFYPLADPSGSYHYERITSFERFFRDLKSDDKDPNDHIMKLLPEEPFVLEGKTVMIQGISDSVVIPDTVRSFGRHRPFQTLPVVCGVFSSVTTAPGMPDDGTIPGPVANPDDYRNERSPDGGIPPSTSTAETSDTGTTNDSDNGEGPTSDGEGRTN